MRRSKTVDAWFARYENPMKSVVQRVREIVLSADPRIDECIKWQAPTFTFEGKDFPRRPVEPVAPPPGLDEALGARPLEVHSGVSLLCLFANAGQVRDLRPRFDMIGRLDTHAVIATAPGEDCDFVSRFFAPGVGIDEDPVTGSAHCSLAPFWSARLGRKVLAARQVSSRGGELECEFSGERVLLRGNALTVLDGQIFV
jgi:predicted PhzF superfamily epimerase YddE/YHI9